MRESRIVTTIIGAVALTGLVAGPAFASTDSGSVNCETVSDKNVYGTQQLVATTSKGTRSWAVTSDSLDRPGNDGYCVPAGG